MTEAERLRTEPAGPWTGDHAAAYLRRWAAAAGATSLEQLARYALAGDQKALARCERVCGEMESWTDHDWEAEPWGPAAKESTP
jgi:hypothetical protein